MAAAPRRKTHTWTSSCENGTNFSSKFCVNPAFHIRCKLSHMCGHLPTCHSETLSIAALYWQPMAAAPAPSCTLALKWPRGNHLSIKKCWSTIDHYGVGFTAVKVYSNETGMQTLCFGKLKLLMCNNSNKCSLTSCSVSVCCLLRKDVSRWSRDSTSSLALTRSRSWECCVRGCSSSLAWEWVWKM